MGSQGASRVCCPPCRARRAPRQLRASAIAEPAAASSPVSWTCMHACMHAVQLPRASLAGGTARRRVYCCCRSLVTPSRAGLVGQASSWRPNPAQRAVSAACPGCRPGRWPPRTAASCLGDAGAAASGSDATSPCPAAAPTSSVTAAPAHGPASPAPCARISSLRPASVVRGKFRSFLEVCDVTWGRLSSTTDTRGHDQHCRGLAPGQTDISSTGARNVSCVTPRVTRLEAWSGVVRLW
jgi:hypothetical protein